MRNRKKKGGSIMVSNKYELLNHELKQKHIRKKTQYHGPIYHYTSAEGLQGIIKDQKLWFSNTQFLNDSSENNYIYNLFPEYPDKYSEKLLDEKYFNLIREIANSYLQNDFGKIDKSTWWAGHIFIASFSKDSDNLNLWNYYTKSQNCTGFNIEFQYAPFKINSRVLDYIHGEVIYDRQKQEKLLANIICKYNNVYKENKSKIEKEPIEQQEFVKNFIDIIELHNIFFKHPAYKDEQEYRCAIYNITNYAGLLPKTRIVNGIFVPYLEIPYDNESITAICSSPSNDDILIKKSLEFLFFSTQKYNSHNILLKESKIPKRY